jgi:predicted double-glycine peptidase
MRFGFHAEVIDHSNFRTIEKWLRRGVPVIVDWMSTAASRPSRTLMACGHYSVVSGLDEKQILLTDPSIGRCRRLSRKRFLHVWFDFKAVSPRAQDDLIIRRLIVVAPQHSFDGQARKQKTTGAKSGPTPRLSGELRGRKSPKLPLPKVGSSTGLGSA